MPILRSGTGTGTHDMSAFIYLIPVALALGGIGLLTFMWTLENKQYDDLRGAAERVLRGKDDRPLS